MTSKSSGSKSRRRRRSSHPPSSGDGSGSAWAVLTHGPGMVSGWS